MIKVYKNIGKNLLILMVLGMILSVFLICISNAMVLEGEEWIVASRYPEATKSGALMLQQGGNAFDAVVAMLASLGFIIHDVYKRWLWISG